MSAMNALLACRNDEIQTMDKKYQDLQFQQTLFLATFLTQSGVDVQSLATQDNKSLLHEIKAQLGSLRPNRESPN